MDLRESYSIVYVFTGPDPVKDHASNAPVTIWSADGAHTIRIDLRQRKGDWVMIGAYRFSAGNGLSVVFTNNADGNVLAIPVPPRRYW